MGKESVEGYEGVNWPSTTGNSSGGGRGNAESMTDLCDTYYGYEDHDDTSGVVWFSPAEIAERNRPALPSLPSGAEKIEGTVKTFFYRNEIWKLELEEYPSYSFRLKYELFDYLNRTSDFASLALYLIGDRLKLTIVRQGEQMTVYRIENLSIDQFRLQAENFNQIPVRHQNENLVRSGRLGESRGCTDVQKIVLHNPKNDTSYPRWFVKSGDYICWQLAFASKQLASYWMDIMREEITSRNGCSFKLRTGLYECSIVDKHGNPPHDWAFEPNRYDRDFGNHLRDRWLRL